MATFFSPIDLLNHFREYIPRLTNDFSNITDVAGVIVDGDPQILRITETAHGLTVGGHVVFVDSKIGTSIIGVTDNGDGTLRFETDTEHDLTEGYTLEVELSGFTDSAFNGVFPIISVPSRTLFEIAASSVPVLNGSEKLIEEWEIGLNGAFQIDRVVDANTYEIDLTGKPAFEAQTLPQIKRSNGYNMWCTVDSDRALAHFDPQQEGHSISDKALYLIMGDSNASKDRSIDNDATAAATAGQKNRTKMINTFDIVVFMNTTKQPMGAKAVEYSWNELLKVMLAVGSNIGFDDFDTSSFLTTLIGHGTGVYGNAYYSHVYTFEYMYEVTQEQSFLTQFIESRAFRDAAVAFSDEQDGSSEDLDGDS